MKPASKPATKPSAKPGMKIALIAENHDPRGGGAERNLIEVAGGLTSRGHRVTALVAGAASKESLDNVNLVAMSDHRPKTAADIVRFADWVEAKLVEGNFDASLSFTTAAAGAVVQPLGGTVRETLNQNIALRETSLSRLLKKIAISLSPKQQALLKLERRCFANPRFRRLASLSRFVTRQVKEHYGLSDARIELIPNAVEFPWLAPADREYGSQKIRAELNLSDKDVAYLFCAMNPRLKGASPLLRALKLVVDSKVPAVLVCTGRWESEQKRLARSLGVQERIRFLGLRTDMEALYCGADVTVLPTFYDPSSRVVLESLAAGTPAITTLFNGASDGLVDLGGVEEGWVIRDPHDFRALSRAMIKLADPLERERYIASAQKIGIDHSIDTHVERLEQLLLSVKGS